MREKTSYELLETMREAVRLLREIYRVLQRDYQPITGFQPIKEQGDPMTLLPIAPGFTPGFSTTTLPAGTVPNPNSKPVWTTSDTVNAPLQANPADATGLSTYVAIPATAAVGTTFSLTINYTNADGTVATQTNSFVIVAAPSPDITGFTPIAQFA
jgi:hypothetical protein